MKRSKIEQSDGVTFHMPLMPEIPVVKKQKEHKDFSDSTADLDSASSSATRPLDSPFIHSDSPFTSPLKPQIRPVNLSAQDEPLASSDDDSLSSVEQAKHFMSALLRAMLKELNVHLAKLSNARNGDDFSDGSEAEDLQREKHCVEQCIALVNHSVFRSSLEREFANVGSSGTSGNNGLYSVSSSVLSSSAITTKTPPHGFARDPSKFYTALSNDSELNGNWHRSMAELVNLLSGRYVSEIDWARDSQLVVEMNTCIMPIVQHLAANGGNRVPSRKDVEQFRAELEALRMSHLLLSLKRQPVHHAPSRKRAGGSVSNRSRSTASFEQQLQPAVSLPEQKSKSGRVIRPVKRAGSSKAYINYADDDSSPTFGKSPRKRAKTSVTPTSSPAKRSSGGYTKCPVKKWTDSEDEQLSRLVKEQNPVNSSRKAAPWSKIASKIPGRNGKQCRERYMNYLDPSIKKENWTDEEDEIVVRLQKTMGNSWSEIAKHLVGRPANAIKNHWYATLQRKRAEINARLARKKGSSSFDFDDEEMPE